MKLDTEARKFLQHLAQEWRKLAPRKSWSLDWPQLHGLGETLGHDAAVAQRIVRQLEQAGALKDKAPDWGVMGAHYVLTDRGLQAALRLQAAPELTEGRAVAEQRGGGTTSWLSSLAGWWGGPLPPRWGQTRAAAVAARAVRAPAAGPRSMPVRKGGSDDHTDVAPTAPPRAAAG
jgi:hypothetical protein